MTGAVVGAGQLVQVSWTRMPDGVEEFELLLFLDGGRSPVRVTEQLDPSVQTYWWRVPPLATPCARLAIRFNRGFGEEPGPESATFQIVAPQRAGRLPVTYRNGELWQATPYGPSWSEPSPPGPQAGTPTTPRWQSVELASLRLGQDAEVGGRVIVSHPTLVTVGDGASPPSVPALSHRPRVVPLRT